MVSVSALAVEPEPYAAAPSPVPRRSPGVAAASATVDNPEELMAANPLVPPMGRPTDSRSQRLSRAALAPIAAWALSVLVLTGAMAASYVYRDRVQAAWPPSQRLYAALGLNTKSASR